MGPRVRVPSHIVGLGAFQGGLEQRLTAGRRNRWLRGSHLRFDCGEVGWETLCWIRRYRR